MKKINHKCFDENGKRICFRVNCEKCGHHITYSCDRIIISAVICFSLNEKGGVEK